ncbi:MAG TPA: hypothetical protein QGF02_02715 [Candidatus Babeliales bacterium]|nr:hypothetical protein [Candidatus Babeliales bacterium]
MYIKRLFCFFIALVCMEQVYSLLHNKNLASMEQLKEQNIVVFVHGTVNAPRTTGQLIKALRDNTQSSEYGKRTIAMRNDPFFYQSQPIGPLGLRPIDINGFRYGDASGLFAHIYDITNTQANPSTNRTNYYTFGWTGQLNRPARIKAAKDLLNALVEEVAIYKESGVKVKIHLIGYSHGGNVCLNLAQITPREGALPIDQLVLLGTPIQRCSHNLIKHTMFKKIYNIYSQKDTVQTMDWFSTDAAPTRKFMNFKNKPLPKKLNQIRIRMIEHKTLNNRSKRIITEPDHSQFWFFSWGDYKKDSPLDPIPVAAFIPMILNTTQKSKLNDLAIDIIVKNGTICFEQTNPESLIQALMPNHMISKFMTIITDCIPSNYYKEYQEKYYSKKS